MGMWQQGWEEVGRANANRFYMFCTIAQSSENMSALIKSWIHSRGVQVTLYLSPLIPTGTGLPMQLRLMYSNTQPYTHTSLPNLHRRHEEEHATPNPSSVSATTAQLCSHWQWFIITITKGRFYVCAHILPYLTGLLLCLKCIQTGSSGIMKHFYLHLEFISQILAVALITFF